MTTPLEPKEQFKTPITQRLDVLIRTIIRDYKLIVNNKEITSKERFSVSVGMCEAWAKNFKTQTKLGNNTIEKIKAVYPFINVDWILHGQGEMFLPDVEVKVGVFDEDDKVDDVVEPCPISYHDLEEIHNLRQRCSSLEEDVKFLKSVIKSLIGQKNG